MFSIFSEKKVNLFTIWPILSCTKCKKKEYDCAKRGQNCILFFPERKKINNSDVKFDHPSRYKMVGP